MKDILYGVPIVYNELAIKSHSETVKRDWKERLFSLPWKPLQKDRVVTTFRPSIIYGGGVMVVHPSLKASVQEALIKVP